MQVKKPSTRRRKPSAKAVALMLAMAAHTAMGVALGLAFALIAIRTDMFGIGPAIAAMPDAGFRRADFAITSALAFGLVAAVTGWTLSRPDDD